MAFQKVPLSLKQTEEFKKDWILGIKARVIALKYGYPDVGYVTRQAFRLGLQARAIHSGKQYGLPKGNWEPSRGIKIWVPAMKVY